LKYWLQPIVSVNSNTTTQTIDKSGERVRKMFGEIAPNYDRLNHLLSMNVDHYWRRQVVRRLAPKPGDSILDVCTGTGDLALAFWRQTSGQCPIVGADFCPEMLEIGRAKQKRLGIPAETLRFVEADSQQLPFPDHSFEFVTVAFGLRNIADPQRGLSEMVRVCKPGGSVAVLEFSTPRRQPIKGAYGIYFKHVLPVIGRIVNRNKTSAYNYLPTSVEQFPAYEKLAEWLREAGLNQVKFRPLTFGIATLYVGVK
jgi:demethylmenaquinone methyltransferase / 2-methoxy-6-polyprenyl-1,4-benzoquinol methylase